MPQYFKSKLRKFQVKSEDEARELVITIRTGRHVRVTLTAVFAMKTLFLCPSPKQQLGNLQIR